MEEAASYSGYSMAGFTEGPHAAPAFSGLLVQGTRWQSYLSGGTIMVDLKELTPEEIEAMKVADLRKVADELGVSTRGLLKAPLQAAVLEAFATWQKGQGGEEEPESEKPAEAMEMEEEEGSEAVEKEAEEQVAPLTTQNLEKQALDHAASSDTVSEASRVATVDGGSVRDDVRSLSSAVVGDEDGVGTSAADGDAGKGDEAEEAVVEDKEDKKKAAEAKVSSPPRKKPATSSSKPAEAAAPSSPAKAKVDAPPATTKADRELALKEKLKAKIALKPSAAPTATSTTTAAPPAEEAPKGPVPPAQNPVSCTIRVDGFVRPFTEPKAKQLVADVGGGALEGFWMDSIKTHCYATFEQEEHAVKAREALYGMVWPERAGTLKAEFADITAAEAGCRAAEARAARLSGGGKPAAPAAAAAASGPSAAFAAKSLEQANSLPASASNGSLSRSASSGLYADQQQAEGGAAVRRKRELGPSPDRDKRARVEGEEAGGKRVLGGAAKEQVTKQPTFDELFRATKTKPKLYWKTVEEEKVLVKRKRLVELKAREKERRASGGDRR